MAFINNYSKNRIFLFTISLILILPITTALLMSNQIVLTTENDENSISFQAAIAARCAQEQNQFWPFHDLLYKNNNNLTQLKFLNFADQLGLNRAKFVKCLDNNNIRQLIKDNIKEANALNITGIPFIYVNNQEVMGEISLEELEKIVEIKLDKQNSK